MPCSAYPPCRIAQPGPIACLWLGPASSFASRPICVDNVGKNSGEKAAIAEGTDRKTAGAPSTTSRQESDAGSLARAGSMLESHNSHVGSMAAAPSNTSMAPILPLPAQLSLFTGPPVVTAALNQAIGQNQPQQPSLPGQGQMQSLQSLLQADEPVHQTGPHSYQHSSPTVHQG